MRDVALDVTLSETRDQETVDVSAAVPPWLSALPGGVGVLTSWITPDGEERIASSGTDAVIHVWDPERQVQVGRPLRGHTDGVWTLLVWRDRERTVLFSAGEDGTIRQWNPDTGQASGRALGGFPDDSAGDGERVGHTNWIRALAIWPTTDGGACLASAGADGTVRLWDPVAGEQVGQPLVTRPVALGAWSALAAWSTPQGNRLAIADDHGIVQIWDPGTRRLIEDRQLDHGVGIWALVTWVTLSGEIRLASSGQDGSIKIWDPEAGCQVGTLTGHTSWVPTLSAWRDFDGRTRVVSAGADNMIRLWDAETGAQIGEPLVGHSDAFAALTTWTARSGGQRMAFAGATGSIKVWDANSEAVVRELPVAHTAGRWALASWPDVDGPHIAVGGDDCDIQIWNADTGQLVGSPLRGHTAAVWALTSWIDPAASRRVLASSGDDGSVRVWDTNARCQLGQPMHGHSGWIMALTTWQRSDGSIELLSGGTDGTIRRWDPAIQRPVGEPIEVSGGWVMSLAAWRDADGAKLACGDSAGYIRIWDLDSMELRGSPIRAHRTWVRSIVAWTGPDGATHLASGGYDGRIRLWHPGAAEPGGDVLGVQRGRVGALVTWRDGGARLASTGSDSLIRIWDLDNARQIGNELAGHDGGLWALAAWIDPKGRARIASSGYNGEVRLWDPRTRRAVRTIECGPVAMWGVSDAPAATDAIGRQALATAIADQLSRATSVEDAGPTVIGIDGPWGSGKSTMLRLIQEALAAPRLRATGSRRCLSVRSALQQIRRFGVGRADRGTVDPDRSEEPVEHTVTAWFNPWTYQSGEQVWAGLANEIIEAAAPVLYPTEAHREHYWFAHNLGQIDRYALRRSLRLRTISPILGIALLGSVALAISQLSQPLKFAGLTLTPTVAALVAVLVVFLAGAAHTFGRRAWGRAVHYMPTDLVRGPVSNGFLLTGNERWSAAELDPLRRATAGALYLYQHHIDDIIDDLTAHGHGLVVFVDDVDRCRADTAAEVFEAINLFLSNMVTRRGLRARFVLGLDSTVVASYLDGLYPGQMDLDAVSHGDDPSPGWAFLRKLIQLPVHLPEVTDAGVRNLVESVIGRPDDQEVVPRSGQPAARASEAEFRPDPIAPLLTPTRAALANGHQASPAPGPRLLDGGRPTVPGRSPVDTFTWRSIDRHPRFQAFVAARLASQPVRSVREAKRMLNVWQLYARMLEVSEPLTESAEIITRATNLLLLAEIVTRWPAIQAELHRRIEGRTGLMMLAGAAVDRTIWAEASATVGIDVLRHERALDGLRSLLESYDASAVAELAASLI